ncbi:hypothetical protein Ahy_B02g060603 [Arachis hypogaea]|uniref:Uncharacterized protein n=1 Tax=Arachis hypogaea TaxID=3818 RepID=A0A445AIV4_ARAHY|nr:hypothetical protein Ahy_B02g060603 [Arachis hypogaea]
MGNDINLFQVLHPKNPFAPTLQIMIFHPYFGAVSHTIITTVLKILLMPISKMLPEHLGSGGYAYTWSNNQVGEANIQERLDRAVAIINWKKAFLEEVVKHFQRYRSDHCPILIDVHGESLNLKRPYIFRFEECGLETLNAKRLSKEVGLAQADLDELFYQEDIKWAQRSRANLLKAENKNTRFFHQQASQQRRNKTERITDDEGNLYKEDEKQSIWFSLFDSKCTPEPSQFGW